MMKTLLLGLDNPDGGDPRNALGHDSVVGQTVIQVLGYTVPGYDAGAYLLDFMRFNLYPTGRATAGKGYLRADRDAAARTLAMIEVLNIRDVVLLGHRCAMAFDQILFRKLVPLESAVLDCHGVPIRFWYVPIPNISAAWYRDEANLRHASNLLARLRARQHITRYGGADHAAV